MVISYFKNMNCIMTENNIACPVYISQKITVLELVGNYPANKMCKCKRKASLPL